MNTAEQTVVETVEQAAQRVLDAWDDHVAGSGEGRAWNAMRVPMEQLRSTILGPERSALVCEGNLRDRAASARVLHRRDRVVLEVTLGRAVNVPKSMARRNLGEVLREGSKRLLDAVYPDPTPS